MHAIILAPITDQSVGRGLASVLNGNGTGRLDVRTVVFALCLVHGTVGTSQTLSYEILTVFVRRAVSMCVY